MVAPAAWRPLGVPRRELCLRHTMPVGQTFRWRETASGAGYVGVIGAHVVEVQQLGEADTEYRVVASLEGHAADGPSVDRLVHDYFNLGTDLAALVEQWKGQDGRFKALVPHIPGARMLRQDPVECLFSFVCSSNNHISRIHGMVERLCSRYGRRIAGAEAAAAGDFYSFPTVGQLGAATEEALRADGFGYRAKFITGCVDALSQKPGGGDEWLKGLREVDYKEAVQALVELPGVGPKVAACVCLFSLDKHQAIPVDTHVWDLATNYYKPELKGKTLTPRVMGEVEQAFIDRFGPYAGWAHNTLFVSELASCQELLPVELRTPPKAKAKRKKEAKPKGAAKKEATPKAKKKIRVAGKPAARKEAAVKAEPAPKPATKPKKKNQWARDDRKKDPFADLWD